MDRFKENLDAYCRSPWILIIYDIIIQLFYAPRNEIQDLSSSLNILMNVSIKYKIL